MTDLNQLSARIMSIPVTVHNPSDDYKLGHRDARHDAAELVRSGDLIPLADHEAAIEAAVLAERERIAAWVEGQRAGVPAHGWEFAAAIRNPEATP